MSPNTHTRRRLGRTLPSLQPDRPQTNRTPPELWSIHRSRRDGLWGIILSFPRLFPSVRYVVHVLLSSLPRAEPSRLAWLKRTPIAVAAGRINQNVPRAFPCGGLHVVDRTRWNQRSRPSVTGTQVEPTLLCCTCCLVCQVREVTSCASTSGFTPFMAVPSAGWTVSSCGMQPSRGPTDRWGFPRDDAGRPSDARPVYERTGRESTSCDVGCSGAPRSAQVRRCRGVWRPRWVPYMSLMVPSRQHRAHPLSG